MLHRDTWEADDVDEAAGAVTERGRYATRRSIDRLHSAFMGVLEDAMDTRPETADEARLWLAVLEQALVDEYLGTRRHCDFDPDDRRWRDSGLDARFLRSQRCRDVCDLAGLDWPWFREPVAAYARRRQEAECQTA